MSEKKKVRKVAMKVVEPGEDKVIAVDHGGAMTEVPKEFEKNHAKIRKEALEMED